jgi:hypothetical protein
MEMCVPTLEHIFSKRVRYFNYSFIHLFIYAYLTWLSILQNVE